MPGLTELIGPKYQTSAYSGVIQTAEWEIDFEAAGGYGPADAIIVEILTAGRTINVFGSDVGSTVKYRLAMVAGEKLLIESRVTKVVVDVGSSATMRVLALYVDRWTAAA